MEMTLLDPLMKAVVTCGPPGAGKSVYAAKLAERENAVLSPVMKSVRKSTEMLPFRANGSISGNGLRRWCRSRLARQLF